MANFLADVQLSHKSWRAFREGVIIWDPSQERRSAPLGNPDLPMHCLAADPKGREIAIEHQGQHIQYLVRGVLRAKRQP